MVAVVEPGSVVRQAGCTPTTFATGQAFTEVGCHRGEQPRGRPGLLRITQHYPDRVTDLRELRIDERAGLLTVPGRPVLPDAPAARGPGPVRGPGQPRLKPATASGSAIAVASPTTTRLSSSGRTRAA